LFQFTACLGQGNTFHRLEQKFSF